MSRWVGAGFVLILSAVGSDCGLGYAPKGFGYITTHQLVILGMQNIADFNCAAVDNFG